VEEFAGDFSPQCEGGHASQYNSMNVDQNDCLDGLLMASQCETPSAADLERNVSPFADEMSPKTYHEMVKSITDNGYTPLQGHNQVSSPMDSNLTFAECLSRGSQHVTTPHPSGCISTESQGEQLHLITSTSTNSIVNPAPSPSIVQSPMTPGTPGIQCNEVEQILSPNGSEINVIFNSHKSASNCREWYGALVQVVPEVVKPQQTMKKEHLLIKLPQEGMYMDVLFCG